MTIIRARSISILEAVPSAEVAMRVERRRLPRFEGRRFADTTDVEDIGSLWEGW